jgi:hypothetical protein
VVLYIKPTQTQRATMAEIQVTLKQIKDNDPCTDGWVKVLKANGGVKS